VFWQNHVTADDRVDEMAPNLWDDERGAIFDDEFAPNLWDDEMGAILRVTSQL